MENVKLDEFTTLFYNKENGIASVYFDNGEFSTTLMTFEGISESDFEELYTKLLNNLNNKKEN